MDTLHNQFLVSMPQFCDPHFDKAVVLLCKHDKSGAVGIVINKVTNHKIGGIFKQLDINSTTDKYDNSPVHEGGPVYPELGLIIHNGNKKKWNCSVRISPGLCLTSSRDILNAMAHGNGPTSTLMSLGYAGWGPGQLEEELRENCWFTAPVDQEVLFSTKIKDKWRLSAEILGIDIYHISHQVGHA